MAAAATVGKELTPLLSANNALVFAPEVNIWIVLPGFQYNIAENLDVDLVWQSFFV